MSDTITDAPHHLGLNLQQTGSMNNRFLFLELIFFHSIFPEKLNLKGARGNWPRSEMQAIHDSKVTGERVLNVNKDIYYFLRKSQLMQGYSSCKQNHREKKKKSHTCEICFSSVHSVKIWNVQYDRSEAA